MKKKDLYTPEQISKAVSSLEKRIKCLISDICYLRDFLAAAGVTTTTTTTTSSTTTTTTIA